MRHLSLLYTPNQHCYGVRYSPFDNSILACVACDKFGLTGSASVYILQHLERAFLESKFSIIDSFKMNTSLFDIDWSPVDPSLLLTANGDGSIAVWKWPLNMPNRNPISCSKQHGKEVHSAQWEPSAMRSYHILSTSWDNTIKIWNLSNSGLTDLTCLNGHESLVYTGVWSPKMPGIVLSTSADKTFKIWDVNSSSINSVPIFSSDVNGSDILSADWSKFDQNIFVLGYASGLIEIRDFRYLKDAVLKSIKMAHDYGIRKIRFSPHIPNLFGSVSYDMNTKLWNSKTGNNIEESKNHTEFIYGFDFDPKIPNRLVDCGWDRKVMISEFQVPKDIFN